MRRGLCEGNNHHGRPVPQDELQQGPVREVSERANQADTRNGMDQNRNKTWQEKKDPGVRVCGFFFCLLLEGVCVCVCVCVRQAKQKRPRIPPTHLQHHNVIPPPHIPTRNQDLGKTPTQNENNKNNKNNNTHRQPRQRMALVEAGGYRVRCWPQPQRSAVPQWVQVVGRQNKDSR
jgi:hypothetical protein